MKAPSLGVALRFARRELRGGLAGFRIFLACLALGVAAIASVQSVAEGILTGLRDDGRTILGGDVALRRLYLPASEQERDYLAASSEAFIHFSELRTMARRPQADASTLVELKAVDAGYPLFGQLQLAEGAVFDATTLARRDDQWGALIEPGLAERLGVAVGEVLRVGELAYQIRGLIEREPDRAGSGGTFGFWPRVLVAGGSMSETGLLREGSMVYHNYRLRLAAGTPLTDYRGGLERAFPDAAWRIRDFRNAAPRVERTIERLTLFLTLVGLTALLVGGVGVSNAVSAYLDGKLRTIAMFKCIGAPNRTVFQTYLAQLLALAALGIAIGLAIGALAPPIAGALLARLLPVPLHVGVYPSALVLAALFGLLTTLTFAVWPLARAQEIPGAALFRAAIGGVEGAPRRSMLLLVACCALLLAGLAVVTAVSKPFALWFVGGSALAMLLFYSAARFAMWLAARVGRPRWPGLRLAVANLHRPGAPTPNVVLSLGLGLTVLVAVALIEGNMSRQVRDAIPENAPAYFFVDVQSDQIDSFSTQVAAIEGSSGLRRVPFIRGRVVRMKGIDPEDALVDEDEAWMIRGDRGLTYAAEVPDNTSIIEGEWWPKDYAGPPLASVHKDMVRGFDLALGDTITVNVLGREITATIANVRDLDWRSMQLNFALMLSPEPMQRAPHGFVATVGATAAAEQSIQSLLAREFPNVTAVRIKDALDKVNDILRNIAAAVRSIAGITLLAGTLVLAGAIAAGHRRRVYDSVVLKVLGATRRDVLRAFLLEYGLLGLVTAAIAAALGTLTAWAVQTFVMRGDWVFLPGAVISTALLCTGITLVFGFIGTWRAMGQKAAPLLRNE